MAAIHQAFMYACQGHLTDLLLTICSAVACLKVDLMLALAASWLVRGRHLPICF